MKPPKLTELYLRGFIVTHGEEEEEHLIKRVLELEALEDRAKRLMVKFNDMGAYGESMAIQEALDLNKEEANKIAKEIRSG